MCVSTFVGLIRISYLSEEKSRAGKDPKKSSSPSPCPRQDHSHHTHEVILVL